MQQLERRSDRWVSTGLSILLHAAVLGVLIYGWWSFRHAARPAPTLAIDATVVSSKALNGAGAPKHAPPPTDDQTLPPPPDDQTVPPPPSVAQAQPAPPQTVTRPQPAPLPQPQAAPQVADDQTVPPPPKPATPPPDEQKAKQVHETEQKAAAEAEHRKAAQRKAQEEAKKQAEQQRLAEAKRKAEAERKAAAERKAEAARKLAAERKAEAERKAAARRKAEAERRAAEAKALALSQADLQRGVAEEERLLAARSGPAMATWVQQIQARIQRAWIRPPTARPGIDCTLYVTQVPGGQIVNVKLGPCNGDEAVRQSIQDAAYRASPLPPPPDPALFERDLQIEFKPTD